MTGPVPGAGLTVATAPAASGPATGPDRRRVAVVGGGISGMACARALSAHGVEVVVLDRGHRVGGRMASRTLRDTGLPYDGRTVDVGAAYLTATGADFRAVVADWLTRGLLREWTDTLSTAEPGGRTGSTTGPMRYAAKLGLRSLVEDLAGDLPLLVHPHEVEDVTRTETGVAVDGEPFDAVVLAMPGPQAGDVLDEADPAREVVAGQRYDPVLTLVAAYSERSWDPFEAMFVNDSVHLTLVADDGRRRGDEAPVLVAHSASLFASRHLDDPGAAGPELVDAVARAVGVRSEPVWTDVRRWSLAQPRRTQDTAYWFDGVVGLCGDAWGVASRVETAWSSGDSLGRVIAARLRG